MERVATALFIALLSGCSPVPEAAPPSAPVPLEPSHVAPATSAQAPAAERAPASRLSRKVAWGASCDAEAIDLGQVVAAETCKVPDTTSKAHPAWPQGLQVRTVPASVS